MEIFQFSTLLLTRPLVQVTMGDWHGRSHSNLTPFVLPFVTSEVCSSELDDILEVDDDFHLDVDDVFELERLMELIFI